MTTLENVTGKTEKEIKALYVAAIETLVNFGIDEKEARQIARETFKETIGI